MLRYAIITTLLFVTCAESMHHFRHLGVVTDSLRERLGLTGENADGSSLEMMIPELANLLSSLHTKQRQQLHKFMSRMTSDSDKPHDGEKQEGEGDEEALKRIITKALHHVLTNLRTVEGGQEAARWIKSLRGGTSTSTTSTSTPRTIEDLAENAPENEVQVEKLK